VSRTRRTRGLSIHKRLEHLEALSRNVAGAPIGAQPEVTTAISEYLESLGEWCRSLDSAKPGNWEDLPPNPIGTPVRLTVHAYRKMIAGAEKAESAKRLMPVDAMMRAGKVWRCRGVGAEDRPAHDGE
jgi:hypothetical protein